MPSVPVAPLHGELYCAERLEQLALELARVHHVAPGRHRGRPVLARLHDNRRALERATRRLAEAARAGRSMSPAAEWLVDNAPLVAEQLAEVEQDLPQGYYLDLPKLAGGARAGYPRVFALVWAYVEHTDSRFELDTLRRFVAAYQTVHPLTLGELWAVPISLRIVLVENLRRLADAIVHRRAERALADALADALVDVKRLRPPRWRMWRNARKPLTPAFSARLIQRLHDRDPETSTGLVWLDGALARQHTTAEEVIRREHLQQVELQGPVRDGITSMRLLSSVDWGDFVEEVSLVEAALRDGAPAQRSDFATRDRYRHAVEDLARRSGLTERAVADEVVARTRQARPGQEREADAGYHLISTGREALETAIGYRTPWATRLQRAVPLGPTGRYLASIGLATTLALGVPVALAVRMGAPAVEATALGLLALIPASELGLALVNRAVGRLCGPRKLPKLALEEGVPAALRTLVAVPTLLTDAAEVRALVERLEVHFLANDDGDLRFALVSDWGDARSEHMDADAPLLALAHAEIDALNARHAPSGAPIFFVLHRGRRWNEREGRWMGWERKRGKLHELNRLLRGATDTSFLPAGSDLGDLAALGVRFVLTLDSDTRLPRGAAKRLVGALGHPLNRPVHDPDTGRVIDGYGILQPRITPTLPETGEGTLAQRIFSGPAGIDPYAFAISDVYQDLCDEGSYTGKGIYDVDAFERALAGRTPENALLSHDLFEGLYARAGLVSDIELLESHPARYAVAASRQHRWVRGDWQLVRWIFAPGPISWIGRWKLLDNLRRSLVAPTCLATLIAAWALPSGRAWLWTGFVVAAMTLPVMLQFLLDLLPRRRGLSKRVFLGRLRGDLGLGLARVGLGTALLVGESHRMVDAITRTLSRLATGRGPMLQWVTAAADTANGGPSARQTRRSLAVSLGLAGAAGAAVAVLAPAAALLAAPFLLVWGLAPALVAWISAPRRARARDRLDAAQAVQLRLTARRTWRYFEDFVTAADHDLPPDNFQEDPVGVVAHRTSPTNVGLYLLAAVTAHDMGWIGTSAFVGRVEATFATLDRLERHRGHFYNWYDTVSLAPLEPRYVSTVDSGNLAGHLIALEQACLELAERTLGLEARLAGISDGLAIVREAIARTVDDRRDGAVPSRHLDEVATDLARLLAAPQANPSLWETLAAGADALEDTARALAAERGAAVYADTLTWARALCRVIAQHRDDLASGALPLAGRLTDLAERAARFSRDAQWGFLFDANKKLFSTGFNVSGDRLDAFAYDLLSSECRLASFLAIARGDVPTSHWFRLGRPSRPVGGSSVLLSWSGSMFEYLMPALVMAAPEGSLLDATCRVVVDLQIRHGEALGVPWGMSEAAYNARDLELTYQYGDFGLPALGVKRGLAGDLVIAPYATALAALVDPVAAAKNLLALAQVGASGHYGFYESVDYTAARLPEGARCAVVKAYFAHHQGMSILALCSALGASPMPRRFHAAPIVAATELLLQERPPRDVAVARTSVDEVDVPHHVRQPVLPILHRFDSPYDALPPTQRLSNGRYAVAITAAGGGQSLWNDLAVTRWREDETLDSFGSFVFVRDVATGEVWSAGHQPSGVDAPEYEASFFEHRVTIRRRDGTIGTTLDVVIATADDAEVRQVTLVNSGSRARTFDLTSYAELVLAPDAADNAHRAFSNLFVETSYEPAAQALLATRRPRSSQEVRVWAAHVSAVHGAAPTEPGGRALPAITTGSVQFETDRARFIGRGREVRTASGIHDGRPLSDTVGAVLDPIFSLRRRVTVAPGQSARVVFTTLVGTDRAHLVSLCDAYREEGLFERTVSQAWTHAQVQRRHLRIEPAEAQIYQHLAARVLYADPGMRASKGVLERNQLGQSALWRFGISGDRPILLGRIQDGADGDLVRQLVRAHCYWRVKGMPIDLVLLNEQSHTYGQDLQGDLERLIRASHVAGLKNGVHLLRGEHLADVERDLLLTAARVVIQTRDGPLAEQLIRRLRQPGLPPPRRAAPGVARASEAVTPRLDLAFFNGIGGFSRDGRDYVITLGAGQWTPLPWVNVIANPSFGCVVSEAGGGFTWAENSRENQLTPWSNDPVSDPPGEVLYIRDDESGVTWTATPLPIREDSAYIVYHGQGYTSFVHESHGIALELVTFVAPSDPVKFTRLRLRNTSWRERHLSVAAYVEWILGPLRATAVPFVITSIDPSTGAMFARNHWKADFAQRVAFLDLCGKQRVSSGDRTQWMGRNGSLAAPAGLHLDATGAGPHGPGLDPCGMLMTSLCLAPGETATVVVLLGQGADEAAARSLVERARAMDPDAVLGEVVRGWDAILEVVQVQTPDPAMDLLMNRWLLYQTLSCRLWARAGFYQAGGAYGFRDQLQDGMALTLARPDLAREHLLRAAAHQFPQGDVQHWWHPPSGKGVRTRFSDDRVWLAYTLDHYLEVTGDRGVLDEEVPFIEAPALAVGQEDAYQEPARSVERASLYEHAARGLDISLPVGRHGLPLIGAGDWNDGMNRVGHEGRGESVWLAWFLIRTLDAWIPIAQARGDVAREAAWRTHAAALRVAVEAEAWDGDWYRRAFFDDGEPLGSAANVEGRIDAIAQSWAVLSGAGRPDRAAQAMASLDEHLVRRGDGLVLLLTPPFDRTPKDPGYIKGYLPGVRENGGQYTHAAIWAVMAFAALGDGDKAGELFAMLNPIHHADTRAGLQRYKVEPYVVAADVYGAGAQVGRGGWTWYTGSAAWMYRAGLESILGVRVRGDRLHLSPCIPATWPGFEVTLKHRSARYTIVVTNPNGAQRGVSGLTLDGVALDPVAAVVPLVDDGETHRVQVTLG